jgi:alcohol dehydrogenase (cytochrome c)
MPLNKTLRLGVGSVVAATLQMTAAAATSAQNDAYAVNCAGCHGPTLHGGLGPALAGAAFQKKWRGRTEQLRELIARSMPPADPYSLSASTYDSLTAFISQANHLGEGAPGTSAAVNQVTTAAPAPAKQLPTMAPAPQQSTTSSESAGITASVEARDAQYDRAIAHRTSVGQATTPVGEDKLRNPPAQDWLHWRRTQDAAASSPLQQINASTAKSLALHWTLALPRGTNEITPLVHDGVMFLDSQGTVLALDAESGETIWSFVRPAAAPPMGPPVSQPRGIAIFEDKLYIPTSDNHMIALDMHTGKVVWDHGITGMHSSLRITASPLIAHGKVIQGMAGCAGVGEPGGCFIVALDARSGTEVWRFSTIARPGERNGDTWNGAPYEQRFGASVWSTGSYDPENNLVYFGTGQTYHIATLMRPYAARGKVNSALYTDSTLALNPDTGKLVWFYQHMARDVWDLDWAFERIIATLNIDSRPRKVVITLGKLGIVDVLDAKSGQYLFSHDLGLQNLVTAIDPATGWKTTDPRLEPDPQHSKFICPHAVGLRNWPGTSYDEDTHTLFVPVGDSCMDFTWNLGEGWDIAYGLRPRPGSDGNSGGIAAINLDTRQHTWLDQSRAPAASAVLSTAGGLAFVGTGDRWFKAVDKTTHQVSWQVRLDDVASSAPITFAVRGTQYVAVTTGGGNPNDVSRQPMAPEFDHTTRATTLWVFSLSQ